MNILVIHEVDWLKKGVYEVHDIPELLSLRGHNVTVIDFEEEWQRRGRWDFGRFRTEVVPNAHRVYDQARVELRRPGLVKVPGLDRFSALSSQYLEIKRTIKANKIDVVFL